MPSLIPPWMSCRAMKSAVEPVEQLLLTLIIGIPDRPRLWYIARCPHVESPSGTEQTQPKSGLTIIFDQVDNKGMKESTVNITHTGLLDSGVRYSCVS